MLTPLLSTFIVLSLTGPHLMASLCQCMSSPSPLHRYYINQSRTKGEISGGSESNYCIKTRGCNYIVEEDIVLFMKYGQTCAHRLYLLHCLFRKEARSSC